MYVKTLFQTLCFLTIITLCSCTSSFQVVGDKEITGSKIAVISGLRNTETQIFAQEITKELAQVSKFDVLSQKEIKNRLGNYPVEIRGPYPEMIFTEIDEDYDQTDIDRIKEIQNKLNVDNIYVIWAPIHTKTEGRGGLASVNKVEAIAQFFSFPGCDEIGRGKFEAEYYEGIVPGINLARSPEDGIKKISERVAKKIAEETGMLRE